VVGLVWIHFYTRTDGTFLTQRNLILVALQTSIVVLAAISAVMLIVTRNFDLSVGSAVALVGVVLATLTVKRDWNPLLACLVALGVGVLLGVWQGIWVTGLGVSSFIVTLAGMLYFRGISMIVTDGATVAPLPGSLTRLATGFINPDTSKLLIAIAVALYLTALTVSTRRAVRLGVTKDGRAAMVRGTVPVLLFGALASGSSRTPGCPGW
jgi:ABC-type xylose transport system permease subunit